MDLEEQVALAMATIAKLKASVADGEEITLTSEEAGVIYLLLLGAELVTKKRLKKLRKAVADGS